MGKLPILWLWLCAVIFLHGFQPASAKPLPKPKNFSLEYEDEGGFSAEWKKVKKAKRYQVQLRQDGKRVLSKRVKKRGTELDLSTLQYGEALVRVRSLAGKRKSRWSKQSLIHAREFSLGEATRVLSTETFGLEAGSVVADASAIQISEDLIRIYAFAGDTGVVSATSSDGISFTAESGARLPEGFGMPRVVMTDDDRFRLFTNSTDGIVSSISDDGLNFEQEEGYRIAPGDFTDRALSGAGIVPQLDGSFRLYCSTLPRPSNIEEHLIFSATSTNLLDWTPEDGVRIGEGSNFEESSEHPTGFVDQDGITHLLFSRVAPFPTLFEALSLDGVNFVSERSLRIEGNDPDILFTGERSGLLYFGGFSEEEGGFVSVVPFELQ